MLMQLIPLHADDRPPAAARLSASFASNFPHAVVCAISAIHAHLASLYPNERQLATAFLCPEPVTDVHRAAPFIMRAVGISLATISAGYE